MSDAWDKVRNVIAKDSSGESLFILKNDRDSAVLAFLGEPYTHDAVWCDGFYASARSAAGQSAIAQGANIKERIAINVFLHESKAIRVWDMSTTTAASLMTMKDKYTLDCLFEIQRHGAARDLQTSYQFLFHEKLTDTQKDYLAKQPLIELETFFANKGKAAETPTRELAPAASEGGNVLDDDLPF